MKINRTCKICGGDFSAIKTTQFFCSRKCFKKDYYIRTRANIQEKESKPSFPIKKCGFCENSSQLNFDPVKNYDKFNAWNCPHCGVTNRLLRDYRDDANSYQIIKSIMITIKKPSPVFTTSVYHVYRLPVMRLEQGNKHVITMTCDTLDILNIRKQNRKKIVFS
jgi:hypothetical protein